MSLSTLFNVATGYAYVGVFCIVYRNGALILLIFFELCIFILFMQFSPTSEHLLLAYGRRHSSLLKSVVIDGDTTVPIYTILEVRILSYRFDI